MGVLGRGRGKNRRPREVGWEKSEVDGGGGGRGGRGTRRG